MGASFARAGFTTSATDYLSVLFNLHEVGKNRRELTITQKVRNHNLDLTYCSGVCLLVRVLVWTVVWTPVFEFL